MGNSWTVDLFTFLKSSFIPTMLMILHPMFQIVNVLQISRMDDSVYKVGGFGLGTMFINIFLQHPIICFNLSFNVLVKTAIKD